MAFDFDTLIAQGVRMVTSECKDVTDDDRCEAVFKIVQCTRSAAEKFGFPRVDLF